MAYLGTDEGKKAAKVKSRLDDDLEDIDDDDGSVYEDSSSSSDFSGEEGGDSDDEDGAGKSENKRKRAPSQVTRVEKTGGMEGEDVGIQVTDHLHFNMSVEEEDIWARVRTCSNVDQLLGNVHDGQESGSVLSPLIIQSQLTQGHQGAPHSGVGSAHEEAKAVQEGQKEPAGSTDSTHAGARLEGAKSEVAKEKQDQGGEGTYQKKGHAKDGESAKKAKQEKRALQRAATLRELIHTEETYIERCGWLVDCVEASW